jgi:SAM-dependent methyltransferase
MRAEAVTFLRCPQCHGDLVLAGSADGRGETEREVHTGSLTCASCAAEYPVARGVPRFVPAENYSSSFGFQWNRFGATQLDSRTGLTISRDRFFRESGWRPADLVGRTVLDVGCGAGRFTEIALGAGAHVFSMDYSDAVDACSANFAPHDRLTVVQGDVYRLPFRAGRFDFVYCFGVLQHTPDVRHAFLALAEPLRPGGRLAVDLYPRLRVNILWPKYWLRPITRRIPAPRLFPLVERMVAMLFPVSLALGRVPVVGRKLRYAIPVANYDGLLPLSPAQLKQWAVLDTFDMLAPRYDQPQTTATLESWFRQAGYEDIEVYRDGLVIVRGRRPETSRAPSANQVAATALET